MIQFAILANAVAIASIYFPASSPWHLQLLERGAACILYFIFVGKSARTEPENVFNAQRMVLLLALIVSLVIAFEPLFNRRVVPKSFTEYALLISALIGGTLFVRWRYSDQN